ncbi:MAG: hypothetical protein KA273_00275 [Bacteroidales bacterium]|nr:hypothetical protein [Bacteroidales bacterium]
MFDLYNKLIKKNRRKPLKLILALEKEYGKENILKIPCSYNSFQNIQDKINKNTIICIEKPYESKATNLEFHKITSDPRSHVSVDLFFLGLISQNENLSPKHYIF